MMIRDAKENDSIRAWVERTTKALEAIQAETAGHARAGALPCPCCGGQLRYSVSAVNGHVWARCERNGCVDFIQ